MKEERIEMTSRDLYTKGARVWIPHPERVWEEAELIENFTSKILKVLQPDGNVKVISVQSEDNLPPLSNPDILIGENDLTSLSHLNEPAVLYNLQVRFCNQNAIYTYCGIVLVAINPYTELSIYDTDTIHAYRGQPMGDLDPHIFAVAEEAFTKMEREQKDQSIIVSGESGAGKTVSAKYVMRYFATVGGATTETHVERKVLASSPIMEAIGNAKTTRNDNSSRFGKYTELQFSPKYNIIGASMRTYLLEKSRVVFQAPGERNYHILYQLCAVREEYSFLHLGEATTYRYLNQESVILGVDDAQCFQETKSALITLGFSNNKITDIFRVLASILHLGNIDIRAAGDMDDSSIMETDMHLQVLSQLLGINQQNMRKWLCVRRITSRTDVIEKPMTLLEALGARDALAKYIYAELFSCIVEVINRTLQSSSESKHKFIGVLDIYGFETFNINSFEQFCINYANEKLQQQFNQHVFKLEQEEYLKEEIEWKFIDFYDNQPCIDLIEIKLGILDLLDEECRMPKGSDSSFVEKLYSTCDKWVHFSRPKFGGDSFLIRHFADQVEYQAAGFLEKNRDTVIEEQVEVLRSGNNRLVQRLFLDKDKLTVSTLGASKAPVPKTRISKTTPASYSSANTSTSKNKKTVGSQFRGSLNALVCTINATTPHYIRCIKPNDDKQAFEFNAPRAVQQLRACGVLETIRISAAGFPSRWPYVDFFNRYRVLCRSQDIKRDNMKSTCECILFNFIKGNDKFKFGKTKIFFRAGQVAYLEKLRSDRLRECCILMQKVVRGFLDRRRYLRTTKATVTIQRVARGFIARRQVKQIRRNRAAVIIQRYIRGWVHRVRYMRTVKVISGLQRYIRGMLARKHFMEMKCNKAAVIIQKNVRTWICKKAYKKKLRQVIVAQNAVRRFLARRSLKKLKKEARTVQHHIKLNKGLENKIIKLQQHIDELAKENNSLKSVHNELLETRAKLDTLRGVDVELKKVVNEKTRQEMELQQMASKLEQEHNEKMDLLSEKENLENKYETEKLVWITQCEEMKLHVGELSEQIKLNERNAQELLKSRVESETKHLLKEHNMEMDNYQKILFEKNDLETRCEMLEQELADVKHGKVGNQLRSTLNPSPSSISKFIDRIEDTLNELPDEDLGYGSVRSISSRNTNHSDWSEQTTPECTMNRKKKVASSQSAASDTAQAYTDVQLVLDLQQKLRCVESERDHLHRRLQGHSTSPDCDFKPEDNFKLQELEVENNKLRQDLMKLRETTADSHLGQSADELMNQFRDQEAELVRLREERVQLRTVLAKQTQGLSTIANSNYSTHDLDMQLINEDGELAQAYLTQRKINRQLQDDLDLTSLEWDMEKYDLKREIEKLRDENQRFQEHLLTKEPLNPTEVYLKHEVTRLTNENLKLQVRLDAYSKENKMMRQQLMSIKNYLNELKHKGYAVVLDNKTIEKGQKFKGMFEFQSGDEELVMKNLIQDLKPEVAVLLVPGLPAYIAFMCVRYTDFTNEEEKVRKLLSEFILNVKKVVKRKQDDIKTKVLWLTNTLRLVHNLKQYSGEAAFKDVNTPSQNDQCLVNFDLSAYRMLLSDVVIWIYLLLIRSMKEKLKNIIIPAILEHEAIGLSSGKRGRMGSVSSADPVPAHQALDSLVQELSGFFRLFVHHVLDKELIEQIYKQLFYYICACSLNNLLLRKDLCHWSKGMNIRYNLSHIEQWARDQKLNDPSIMEMLAPIIQAAQLLQARKCDEDVASVCDMCNKMTEPQIVKILNLYAPADDFEERVPLTFIRKVQQRLKEKASCKEESPLLMDVKLIFPLLLPFNPSGIMLEEIEIPEALNLPMLKKM